MEVVYLFVKWKCLILVDYYIELGYGIYMDMNVICLDEELGNLYLFYVD